MNNQIFNDLLQIGIIIPNITIIFLMICYGSWRLDVYNTMILGPVKH